MKKIESSEGPPATCPLPPTPRLDIKVFWQYLICNFLFRELINLAFGYPTRHGARVFASRRGRSRDLKLRDKNIYKKIETLNKHLFNKLSTNKNIKNYYFLKYYNTKKNNLKLLYHYMVNNL